MVVASYIFYGWWDWHYIFLLGGSTIANQLFAKMIAPTREPFRKALLFVAVAVNLGVLAYFKYYGFFATSVVNTLGDIGVKVSPPLFQIILPVGISFFTFQALSYVIDVYRGQGRARPLSSTSRPTCRSSRSSSPVRSCGRTEFLPQLEERPDPRVPRRQPRVPAHRRGPVQEDRRRRLPRRRDRRRGVRRAREPQLARVLVASTATRSRSTSTSAATPTSRSARAAARLPASRELRLAVPARSLQDFWRRWHITLSRGCATTSTSRSAATAARGGRRTAT